ncbi:MAG: ABC transporter permease [Deltaproteobacteria bacterium]|nr:MAG: ABC transporter permease [Deltaproteobacteria bacterium]
MNHTMAIARKEWRAAFLSPVALIFLGIFLLVSLFVFFFVKGFFARNIADIRPFFEFMPIMLALLASAFTMRLWSEEARAGTLEVLLTMPVKVRELVIGKFLAGLGLVAVALLLTLPVPITVSMLGDLDWGPVFGGYLGLMLLSASYLAIGLLMSSLTPNQLVSLLLSLVVCGVFILIGYLPSWLPMGIFIDETLRGLGIGSRFESMLRGVLDLRDLVYYASLAAVFLVLNMYSLESRRFGSSERSRKRRRSLVVALWLFVANLVVFNVGMAPAQRLRVDMTEWGEYSISDVTKRLLASAREPLLVRGYFSDKTHPLLDPLVPRIKDFLRELEAVGGPNVEAEFVDPTSDEDVEKEANSKYNIKPVPFRFASKFEDSVVNAYFHILVRYGDKYEVLNFADLIDVEVHGTDVKVRLRNLEYDIARAIKKVMREFKSLEAICAQLPDTAKLKVFASEQALPEELKDVPANIRKVAGEIEQRCKGKFEYQVVDPDQPNSGYTREQLYKTYGIKPMALSLFDDKTFYLSLVLQVGKRAEVLNVPRKLTEAEIKRELEASLQRHAPGFMKTIGLVAPKQAPRPNVPGMPPPRTPTFQLLKRQLEQTYEVEDVDLSSGRVPGYVDVLLVVSPREFGERQRYAIDQFLMRGGSVIVAAGSYVFEPSFTGELNVNMQKTGLEELLEHYGIELKKAVVLDRKAASFPIPVVRQLGALRIREIRKVPYAPFVFITPESLNRQNPATSAISQLVLHWASPVRCKSEKAEGEGNPKCEVLVQSSDQAWEVPYFTAQPDFQRFPETGFKVPEKMGKIPLAVSLVGRLESYYKDKQPPVFGEDKGSDKDEKKSGTRGAVIERAEADARLVVVGSSSFLHDIVLQLTGQVSDAHLADLQFVNNLVDWAVEDAELLSIRSREQYARTLAELTTGEKIGWEAGNFLFAILAVVVLGLVNLGKRSAAEPIVAAKDKVKTAGE